MNRERLLDILEDIQERNNQTFTGSNEAELHTREDIADFIIIEMEKKKPNGDNEARLSPKLKAKELTNSIYQPMGHLMCHVSSNEMWEYAKERAKEQVETIMEELPMYTGNLNIRWKYWDEVLTELKTMP